MQWLPLDLLEPGMVVARNVVNDKGMVLVGKNAELTAGTIERLRNQRTKKVAVQGAPVQLAEYLPKTLERRLADLEIGFSLVADNPLMQKFRVLVKAHFIEKGADTNLRNKKREVAADIAAALGRDGIAGMLKGGGSR